MTPLLVQCTALLLLVAFGIACLVRKSSYANTAVQALFFLAGLTGIVGSIAYLSNGELSTTGLTVFKISGWLFQIDSWSAFFTIIVCAGLAITSIYAGEYLKRYREKYPMALVNGATALFALGMLAVLYSATVFSFLFFWEVMSLAAYFLVIADRENASLTAGRIYIIMTHLGFVCLLVAFMILSQGNINASLGELSMQSAGVSGTMMAVAFFLFLAGFGSKAGLVPLHNWLPQAHPQAPSPSSALLSGVMLNVALYGFLRAVTSFFPSIPMTWAIVVIVIGLLSALFGVLYAAVETDLKRMLAWSSIENLGLIFSAVGLALLFLPINVGLAIVFISAALIHTFNHAIFKIGLFLAAGSIIAETHTRNIDEMGGLAKTWPTFSKWFLGLVFAAAALPPLGTFYGEWLYVQGLLGALAVEAPIKSFFFIVILAVIGLVSGLAIFTFIKTFASIFLSRPRTESVAVAKPLPLALTVPIAVTVVLLIGTGFFAAFLQKVALITAGVPASIIDAMAKKSSYLVEPLIDASKSIDNVNLRPAAVMMLVILSLVAVFLVRKVTTRRKEAVRITDTWDCGQTITPRMEYTATAFSAPIRFFFRSLLMINKRIEATPVVATNPWIAKRVVVAGMKSVWDEGIYRPVAKGVVRVAEKVKLLQSGIIQLYLLFILVVLVLVLIFAL